MSNVTNFSLINKTNAVYALKILRTVRHIVAQAAYRCILASGLVAVSGSFSLAATGSAPLAVNDSASSTSSGVVIAPLANDSGLKNTPVTLSIISGPTNGSAILLANNTVAYKPNAFNGTDSFTYRVKDADGDLATATVSIKVTCSTCASVSSKSLRVSWSASSGGVLGYYVYHGTTSSTVSTFASTVPGTSTTYTTLAKNLNLQTGAQVCFRVRAYNTAGVSAFSSAVCKIA